MDHYEYQQLIADVEYMAVYQPIRDYCYKFTKRPLSRYGCTERQYEYADDLRSGFVDFVCHWLADKKMELDDVSATTGEFEARFARLEAHYLQYIERLPVRFWLDYISDRRPRGNWQWEIDIIYIQPMLETIRSAARTGGYLR